MSSLILIDDTACHVDAAVAIGASGARVGGCDGVTRDVVAAALEAYTCRVERGDTCQMDTSGDDTCQVEGVGTCQMDTSGDDTWRTAEDEYSAAELSKRAALVGEGRSRRDAFEEVRREKQQRLHRAGEARANSEVRSRDDALCNRAVIASAYDHALIAP